MQRDKDELAQRMTKLLEKELGKPLEKASADEVEAVKVKLGIGRRTRPPRRRPAPIPIDMARANASALNSVPEGNKRRASGTTGTKQGVRKKARFT